MSKEKQEMWQRVRKLTGFRSDDPALDYLQERGLISDLCIRAEDVAFSDLVKAERVLKR